MRTVGSAEQLDFFISYNKADKAWAEWIAWELENVGYSTIIDSWDFRPGRNWALLMDEACRTARQIIAVLSPAFLSSIYTQPEWARYFAFDPLGRQQLILPVTVENCSPGGLLKALVDIKLVGCSLEEARARLLSGAGGERPKPATMPRFPGAHSPFPPAEAAVVGRAVEPEPDRAAVTEPAHALDWVLASGWNEPVWLDEVVDRSPWDPPVIEVHVLPSPGTPPLSEVALHDAADRLVPFGRAAGLFSGGQSVDLHRNGDAVLATSAPMTGAPDCLAGLAVTRTGQLSAWAALPGDTAEMSRRSLAEGQVAKLLHLISQIAQVRTGRVGLALHLSPDGSRLTFGCHVSGELLGTAYREIAHDLTLAYFQ